MYDKDFYDENHKYSINSAKEVIAYIEKILPGIATVADIGCGMGAWLNEWKKHGKKSLRFR